MGHIWATTKCVLFQGFKWFKAVHIARASLICSEMREPGTLPYQETTTAVNIKEPGAHFIHALWAYNTNLQNICSSDEKYLSPMSLFCTALSGKIKFRPKYHRIIFGSWNYKRFLMGAIRHINGTRFEITAYGWFRNARHNISMLFTQNSSSASIH